MQYSTRSVMMRPGGPVSGSSGQLTRSPTPGSRRQLPHDQHPQVMSTRVTNTFPSASLNVEPGALHVTCRQPSPIRPSFSNDRTKKLSESETGDQAAGLGHQTPPAPVLTNLGFPHASSSGMRMDLSDKALPLPVVTASFAHQAPGSTGMYHESGDKTLPLPVAVKDGGASHLETVVTRLESSMTAAIGELRIELPRLQKECLAQKADIDTINDAHANFKSRIDVLEKTISELGESCSQQNKFFITEATANHQMITSQVEELEKCLVEEASARNKLEQGLAEETKARSELEKAQIRAVQVMDRTLSKEVEARQQVEKAIEMLDSSLVEEAEARSELESVLGKDLREHASREAQQAREMVSREMSERISGHKVLREEVQLQQQVLSRLTLRLDEAIMELHTELPRLGQEDIAQRAELSNVSEAVAACMAQLEQAETVVAGECESRLESEKRLHGHFKEQLERLDSMIDKEIESRTHSEKVLTKEVKLLGEQLEQRKVEVQENAACLNLQLQTLKEQSMERVDALEKLVTETTEQEPGIRSWVTTRIKESENSLRSWVNATVMGHVNALDRALRKEVGERTASLQQLSESVGHNVDRWYQIQGKIDEVHLELSKGNLGSARTLCPDLTSREDMRRPG